MSIENRICAYGDLLENEALSRHTTFHVGGRARYFIYPKNEISLIRVLEILHEENVEYFIFGKGSNLLCSDADYDGAIICLDRYFNDCSVEEDGTIMAQAGASLIYLANEAMKHSLSGLEFASGIPGSVGGALFMNAGAYKSDMSHILKEVYVIKDGINIQTVSVDDLEYSYRSSLFQKHRNWIIVGCKLKLQKGEQSAIRGLIESRRNRRIETQPLNYPSGGSMFRNPNDYQAWELIEKIGFRGKRIGGASVSSKHTNFIINEDHASANDIKTLVNMIQSEVKKQFDIELLTEVEQFNWKSTK